MVSTLSHDPEIDTHRSADQLTNAYPSCVSYEIFSSSITTPEELITSLLATVLTKDFYHCSYLTVLKMFLCTLAFSAKL